MEERIEPLTRNRAVKRPAWKALEAHAEKVREFHLRQLFADDPKRGGRMTAEAAGIYLDYSKNRITDETLKLLIQLAEESGLQERIDAMYRGRRSTSRKSGRSCTWRCAHREGPLLPSMEKTSRLVKGVMYANRNGWSWKNGRQHGTAAS